MKDFQGKRKEQVQFSEKIIWYSLVGISVYFLIVLICFLIKKFICE